MGAPAYTPARSVPRTCASRISAVALGLSIAWRWSSSAARRTSWVDRITSLLPVGLLLARELIRALGREQRVRERIGAAGEHGRQLMHRHVDSVVRDATVGEVVRADLLR